MPRASTPLLAALGRGINDMEKSINDLKREERPSKVIVAAIADGQQNASQEFSKAQIERIIKGKTEVNGWQFVFLSADLAAIRDANSVGIHADAVLLFEKSKKGVSGAWTSLTEATSRYRSDRKKKIGFGQVTPKQSDGSAKKKKTRGA